MISERMTQVMIENLQLLLTGFRSALTLPHLLVCTAGVVVGLFVGAMPGIGPVIGVSVLLPITYRMDPTTAIIMLGALYYSTMYGGSISSVLLNIPGDAAAVALTLDGYPLAKKGYAGKALSTCFMSSFIGGTIGILILTLCAPWLADIGLKFGSPELALLILLAMTSIGWMLGEDPILGILATALGFLFATVGPDQAQGLLRYTFRFPKLMSGIPFIPLVIGAFGFSQVIEMMSQKKQQQECIAEKITTKDLLLTRKEILRILPVQIRSGFLGCFIGVMPGAGGTTASFLSYIVERRIGKHRDEMGTGVIEGCAAPDAANNAAAASSFAPLLTLGIPGSSTTAVLLGGLMLWGLQPGPLLFTNNPGVVWPTIASFYIANVLGIAVCFCIIPLAVKAIRVPNQILAPIIFAICVVGAFAGSNSMFDVWLMMAVGVFSYFLKKAKIPMAPMLLAFVLCPMLEKYVRQSFDMGRGDWGIFVESNICRVFLLAILLFVFAPVILHLEKKIRHAH